MTNSASTWFTSPPPAPGKQQTDFPKAFLSVSRTEFYGQDAEHQPLELTIKVRQDDHTYADGVLPDTIHGHAFIVGPAGSIASQVVPAGKDIQSNTVLPAFDGWTGLFNGDGMVYRLDFHTTLNQTETGKAWLMTRFVKPPAFYADELTFSKALVEAAMLAEAATLENTAAKPAAKLKFKNLGMTRTSPILGYCSQINTAFLPMPFDDGAAAVGHQ
jgi:hypothetical protein